MNKKNHILKILNKIFIYRWLRESVKYIMEKLHILKRVNTLNYTYLTIFNKTVNKIEGVKYYEPYDYTEKYVYAKDNKKSVMGKHSDIIWQCWLQGEENMPEIVKTCIKSVNNIYPDKKHILITEKNLNEYIKFPEYIYEKYKAGMISKIHFSDFLRIALLEKYGGLWLDSTIYLTDRLPNEAFTMDFFTYRDSRSMDYKYIKNMNQLRLMCNLYKDVILMPVVWIISGRSHNLLITKWYNMMLEYWKYENSASHYSFCDYLFIDMILCDEEARNEFEKIPFYPAKPSYVLHNVLFDNYDEILFHDIKSLTPIHKLTYKNLPEQFPENSFYKHIINNQI